MSILHSSSGRKSNDFFLDHVLYYTLEILIVA
jgi:hypothetical protein